MNFWCLVGLRIEHGDVAFIEHRPSFEVYCLDCLDPCGLDWIATYCVHLFYCFFCCRQVIDAVGFLEKVLGFLAWFPWLPLSLCLRQRDAVADALILFSNEDWFVSAGDQNICLFVDLQLFISEDGNVAIIGRLFNAHQ